MAGRAPRARTLVLVVAVLGVVVWLFLKTVTQTNAEPYSLTGVGLTGWRLVMPDASSNVLLGLQPPGELRQKVHTQIFERTMTSLVQPEVPLPVVLRREFEGSAYATLTPEALRQRAQLSGLETASFEPVCVGVDRGAGRSRVLYFAVFKAAAFDAFRDQLGLPRGTLRPILPVAASDPATAVMPPDENTGRDCLAPLRVAE